jgi:predicted ATPase
VLTRLSDLQPLLLVADDFHWADGETLHLLRRLARAAPQARLLVLAAFRERDDEIRGVLHETLVDLLRLDGVTRLSLANLSAADMSAFVRASTDAEATVELASVLDTLTGGNALLLCELWRELVDSDAVEVDGRAHLTRPLAELRVSDRVGGVVHQRLSRLTPATAALVELAAVIGTRFEERVLAEAARHEKGAVASLEQVLEAGFVEELPNPVTACRFTHELVRRAVYDGIKPMRRAELHVHVGKALERIHRRDLDSVLPELAHHFTLAAPVVGPKRGIKYNLRAAKAALATAAATERAAWLTSAARLKNQRDFNIGDPLKRAIPGSMNVRRRL